MKTFSTKTIAENFSKAAKNYDDAAEVQKLAARKLCEIALPLVKENSRILDLGSGTSFLAREFLNNEKFRQKNVQFYEVDLSLEMLQCWADRPKENFFAIQADIENLPFQPKSFDLIISSFSLQWLKNFEKTFSRIFEILVPGGVFIFCLPTSESLFELREASLASGCDFNFKELPKIKNLKSALKKSGFEEKKFAEEILKQTFVNGSEALKSLKKIGARLTTTKRNFISKTQLKQFNNFCLKNFSADNKSTRLSWFVPYFVSEKKTNKMLGKLIKKIIGRSEKPKESGGAKFALQLREKSEKFSQFLGEQFQLAQEEVSVVRKKCKNLRETNYLLGLKHLENGRLSDAIFRFRLIKKFWPDLFDAYYQLAYCLILKNKPKKAKEVLEELLSKKPDYGQAASDLLNHINSNFDA